MYLARFTESRYSPEKPWLYSLFYLDVETSRSIVKKWYEQCTHCCSAWRAWFLRVAFTTTTTLYTSFERALVTITIGSLVGFILNHPVLYLFGWVGGIWAIFSGIFLLVTPSNGGSNIHPGIFAIGLGVFMGCRSVTIGFNLIKYRAYVVYYMKRAWFAMKWPCTIINDTIWHGCAYCRNASINHTLSNITSAWLNQDNERQM